MVLATEIEVEQPKNRSRDDIPWYRIDMRFPAGHDDLSLVEHTSSAIFGKLIHLNAKVKARGGRIWLCSIQPAVLEVIHTCKLDSIFDIRQDEADALPRF